MKTYTLKLKTASTVNYSIYDGATALTDAELTALFTAAGSAYFVFDFNSLTPTNTTSLTIVDSNDAAVVTNTGLTGIAENKNFKGEWAASATSFSSFIKLTTYGLDEAQLSGLVGKIKDAGKAESGAGAPTTSTAGKYIGQLYLDTTNDDLYYLSAITPQGTTPETYEYTWETVGGGGGGIQNALIIREWS